jgi:hypothetical protein
MIMKWMMITPATVSRRKTFPFPHFRAQKRGKGLFKCIFHQKKKMYKNQTTWSTENERKTKNSHRTLYSWKSLGIQLNLKTKPKASFFFFTVHTRAYVNDFLKKWNPHGKIVLNCSFLLKRYYVITVHALRGYPCKEYKLVWLNLIPNVSARIPKIFSIIRRKNYQNLHTFQAIFEEESSFIP